jgi:hypothetical protein
MSVGSKMHSLGESTYFLKTVYEPLKEIMGDKDYVFVKDPINGYTIHTDRIDGKLLESVDDLLNDSFGSNFRKIHYNHNMEISWQKINKYAECETVEDLVAVAPDKHEQYTTSPYSTPWRTLDLTSDGDFIYPLPKLKSLWVGWGYSYFRNVSVPKFKISLPSLSSNTGRLFNTVPAKEIECDLPLITNCDSLCGYCRSLERVKAYTPKGTGFNYAFVECGKLTTVEIDLSKATTMDGCFTKTILNKESALRILNNIPSYTSGSHPLTIGIHVDHKDDEEVLTAIANAEAKGWTLTLQWNGTPTVQTTSTFGLRKPSIYAKLSEIERPNGSKEQILDWGHYVTNFEDYQEFSSLEEAYEHFDLPNNTEN